jgi:hypothetical protein
MYFYSFYLLLWKFLLILNILQKAASEFPPHPTPQQDWRQLKGIGSLNSAFEVADNQSSASYEK